MDKNKIFIVGMLALFLWPSTSSGYVISRNKILQNASQATIIRPEASSRDNLPNSMTLDRQMIIEFFNCDSREGSLGYQVGYDDACDWMRARLGIKKSPFASRPSSGMKPLSYHTAQYSEAFPIQVGGYMRLNASMYRVRYWDDHAFRWPGNEAKISDDAEWRIYPLNPSSIRNITVTDIVIGDYEDLNQTG